MNGVQKNQIYCNQHLWCDQNNSLHQLQKLHCTNLKIAKQVEKLLQFAKLLWNQQDFQSFSFAIWFKCKIKDKNGSFFWVIQSACTWTIMITNDCSWQPKYKYEWVWTRNVTFPVNKDVNIKSRCFVDEFILTKFNWFIKNFKKISTICFL